MKLKSPFLIGLGGLVATRAICSWMGTLHSKVFYRGHPGLDPGSPHCRGQKIYLFWHEYILLPLYLRGHCSLAMLLSRHTDAEILSHVARHMGFGFVRGSTNRGGVAALRELFRKGKRMHLTLTPDGPRGPRRQMAPGAVYLASRLGLPIILLGFGYERPWRVRKAWDRFAIPRPHSRARIVVSPEIHVPPDLSRDDQEHFRRRLEDDLNAINSEAEAWAESGVRRPGEMTLIPGPFQPLLDRIEPACTLPHGSLQNSSEECLS